MKLKIFKPVIFLMALSALGDQVLAQDTSANSGAESKSVKSIKILNLKLDLDIKPIELAMDNLNISLNSGLKNLNQNLSIIGPVISTNVNTVVSNIHLDINDNDLNVTVDNGGTQEKVKTYSKSYSFDANDKLVISNKYGSVVVNTWNKNEVKVDVQIKGIAKDDETAQKLIDAISISDSKIGNMVLFKTNFGSSSGNNSIWDLFNNQNDRHKAEVNYTIYMPSKNALAIDNRYGATQLPDFDGKVEINSAYGSFSAKALSHAGNEIKVKYGSASIESLGSGAVDVGYGSLDLGSVDKLNADISYSSVRIGKIRNSASIDAHYAGGIQIDELDKNFTNLSVNTSYSSIKVNLNNATNADFDVTVHYSGFDYSGVPVEITQKDPPDSARGFHSTQNYKGHIGKGDGGRMISIHSTYGGVKFE
jgi:hypothetical protein